MHFVVFLLISLGSSFALAQQQDLLRNIGDVLAVTDQVLAESVDASSVELSGELSAGALTQVRAREKWIHISLKNPSCLMSSASSQEKPKLVFARPYGADEVRALRAEFGSQSFEDVLASARSRGETRCSVEPAAKLLGWNRLHIFSGPKDLYAADLASALAEAGREIKKKCGIEVPEKSLIADVLARRWQKKPKLMESDLAALKGSLPTFDRLELAQEVARSLGRSGKIRKVLSGGGQYDLLTSLLVRLSRPNEKVVTVNKGAGSAGETLVVFQSVEKNQSGEDVPMFSVLSSGANSVANSVADTMSSDDGDLRASDVVVARVATSAPIAAPNEEVQGDALKVAKEFLALRDKGRQQPVVKPVVTHCGGQPCTLRVGQMSESQIVVAVAQAVSVNGTKLDVEESAMKIQSPSTPTQTTVDVSSGGKPTITIKDTKTDAKTLPNVFWDGAGFDLAKVKSSDSGSSPDPRLPEIEPEMTDRYGKKKGPSNLSVSYRRDAPTAEETLQLIGGARRLRKKVWAVKYDLSPSIFVAAGRPPGARSSSAVIGVQVRGFCTRVFCPGE